MPIHRSITRINNTDNKYSVINLCCCILLCYVIFSIILSNNGVNGITIFFIIISTSAVGGCGFYICVIRTERELELDLNSDIQDIEDIEEIDVITFDELVNGVPTVTAYPLPDNYTPQRTVEAVICQPEDSL